MKEIIIENYPKKLLTLCENIRNYIMKQHSKGANTEEYRDLLKKLYLFEGLTFPKNFETTLNIKMLCDIICSAAFINSLKNGCIFSCEISESYYAHTVNVRLIEIMLCIITKNLSANGGKLTIGIKGNSLFLKSESLPYCENLKIILKSLNALYLKNYAGKFSEIIVPLKKGCKINYSPKNEYYYLKDKFSPFNIY